MIKKIGFIGAGHIAGYMLQGFMNVENNFQFTLADPDPEKLAALSRKYGCATTTQNQDVLDQSDLIILAIRPVDLTSALEELDFRQDQLVASVVAGAALETLNPLVAPAKAVRVLPISCVAINKSPVLVFPENKQVQELFSLLGQVHVLPGESTFTPGTSLVGAFYAWVIALMEETASWTENQGIDPKMSRDLVIETIEGACGMARHQEEMSLKEIWNTLATPGGISEHGAKILNERESLTAWSDALEAVTQKMRKQ